MAQTPSCWAEKRQKPKKAKRGPDAALAEVPQYLHEARGMLHDIRSKVKEAEKKYCITNMDQILAVVAQNLAKFEAAQEERPAYLTDDPTALAQRRRSIPVLVALFSQLEQRHVNTVVDAISYLLRHLTRPGLWLALRVRKYKRSLRVVQRTCGRWLVTLRQKKKLLLSFWSKREAAARETIPAVTTGRVVPLRKVNQTAYQDADEVQKLYFGCYVPKELKQDVIQELYVKSRDAWRAAWREWRAEVDRIARSIEQQREAMRKMIRSENAVRFMCGLPTKYDATFAAASSPSPSLASRRSPTSSSTLLGHASEPTLFWFEAAVTEKSIDDLILAAYTRDRHKSLKRLAEVGIAPPKHSFIAPVGPSQRATILSELYKTGNPTLPHACSPLYPHGPLNHLQQNTDTFYAMLRRRKRNAKPAKPPDPKTPLSKSPLGASGCLTPPVLQLTGGRARMRDQRGASVGRVRAGDEPVRFFVGECTFKGCKCLMYTAVGNEVFDAKEADAGSCVCARCLHWCRYHGVKETELEAWRAAATFCGPAGGGRAASARKGRRRPLLSEAAQPASGRGPRRGKDGTSENLLSLPSNEAGPQSALRRDLVLFERTPYYKKRIGLLWRSVEQEAADLANRDL
ncbi:hypothetical protein DIPPA_28077 [Diplonema papillatum]|nr:hypothetical protein DIPPA_28077 [Diplonema papillatum]|eukprot:gene18779-28995_t